MREHRDEPIDQPRQPIPPGAPATLPPQIGDKVRYAGHAGRVADPDDVWNQRRERDGIVVDSYVDEYRRARGEDPRTLVVYEAAPLGYGLGYRREYYHAPHGSLRVVARATYTPVTTDRDPPPGAAS